VGTGSRVDSVQVKMRAASSSRACKVASAQVTGWQEGGVEGEGEGEGKGKGKGEGDSANLSSCTRDGSRVRSAKQLQRGGTKTRGPVHGLSSPG
jgi:hypothetical protein